MESARDADNDTDSPEKASEIVSDNILSQSEIEALLNSLQGASDGAPGAAPGAAAPGFTPTKSPALKGAIAYEVYDFRRPDKLSKEQLRTLQMIHETFARHAATGLSAYLRSPVQIDLISLEQVPYEDYLRGIENSVFNVLSLPPLTGQAVLEVEFGLVFSMIDRLLGGPGRSVNRTVLTDIERPLVKQMVERLFSGLKTAWEGVVIVNPGIEQMETTSQFVQIAPPTDIVVTILFEVRVGPLRGAMSLCMPYLLLKPITGKLSAQKWFVNSNKRQSSSNRRLLSHQIAQTEVDCTVLLGKSRMNVRQFMDLNIGDVIELQSGAKDDLDFLVKKVPKFRGRPATSGKKLVFTVTESIKED